MTRPTWGDLVRLSEKAPAKWRPGAYASVCGMIKVETALHAETFECPIGTMVYTVEYPDGSSVQVPENFLEQNPQFPWQA